MPNDYLGFTILTATGIPVYAMTASDLMPLIWCLYGLFLLVEKAPKVVKTLCVFSKYIKKRFFK